MLEYYTIPYVFNQQHLSFFRPERLLHGIKVPINQYSEDHLKGVVVFG